MDHWRALTGGGGGHAHFHERASNPWVTDGRVPRSALASVDRDLREFYEAGGAPGFRTRRERDTARAISAEGGPDGRGVPEYSMGAPSVVLGGIAALAEQDRAAQRRSGVPERLLWSQHDFARTSTEPRPYAVARAGAFGGGRSSVRTGLAHTHSHAGDSLFAYKRLDRPELRGGRDRPEFDPFEDGGAEKAALRAWSKRQAALAAAHGLEDPWPRSDRLRSIGTLMERSDPMIAGAPMEHYDARKTVDAYRARSHTGFLH